MNTKTENKKQNSTALQKVAFGASLLFIGLLIALFLSFFSKLLIARFWTETQFGIFALTFSILSICKMVSTLGLKRSISRNIAFIRGKKDFKKLRKVIASSIYLGLFASLAVGLFVFLFSEFLAVELFHEPALIKPLRIISVGIPFFTLIDIILSIFRGFNQVKQTVIFNQILAGFLFFCLLLPVVFLNLSFIYVFYALVFSYVITIIFLVKYSLRQIDSIKMFKVKSVFSTAAKELIIFSLPLLGTAMLNKVITWTDTLMLGGIKTVAEVGLYTVSRNISTIIEFPLGALLIIYIPIFSGLYAKNKLDEMKTNFIIITKWICSLTLPLFIFLFLFPENVIKFLFGADYIFASDALRILSLGFIFYNYAGPSGATLITMGRSKFILFTTLSTAIINVILNLLLIPVYGIIGAALASSISLISIGLVKSLKLFRISGIQPLSKNLIKPTFVSLLILLPLSIYIIHKIEITWPLLILLFVLFYAVYMLALIFTKSIDEEDINMIKTIEKKPNGTIAKIRRLLSKFT